MWLYLISGFALNAITNSSKITLPTLATIGLRMCDLRGSNDNFIYNALERLNKLQSKNT